MLPHAFSRRVSARVSVGLAATGLVALGGCAHVAPVASPRAVATARPQATRPARPLPVPPVKVDPLSADEASARFAESHAPIPDLTGAPPIAPIRMGRHSGRGGEKRPRERIDPDLMRLTRVLGSLRSARGVGPKTLAPKVVVAEWDRMIGRLDTYLDQPPADTPPMELVRAKVTVETELHSDTHAWRLPGSTVARVRSRLAYLEHRIEQARMRLLPVPRHAPSRLEWPIDPVVVNSPFGLRTDPIDGKERFHYGVDLNGYIGQAVTAAADGVVIWAGWRGGHGRHVEIAHGGGWVTGYSHLSRILVHRGDHVETGDLVGLVGSTGRSTGPHLHFEVWHHGHVLDPFDVLGDPVFTNANPGRGTGGP